MRKKILYIRENKPGGTNNYCKALFNLFAKDPVLEPLPVADIPAIHSHLFHYYYRQTALTRAISQADIVHINGYTALGSIQAFLTAKHLHKPVVYTAHWHPFECLRHPLLGKWFFHILFRPAIRKFANVVTTINNEDTLFFQKIHPQVFQLPHWSKPLLLQSPPKKNPRMILFVGRTDDPVKGFEHLYSIPNGQYEVHCVGKGRILRKDFHQHIGISDVELATLYAKASLVVIPSKYEAFSYAALEALSYGTPVLLSERVRIADYLDGVKGFQIFHYGDHTDFLNKIALSLGMVVETDKIKKIFDPEMIKEHYRSIYLNL